MPVLKNVKNILTWSIANIAQRSADIVQRNAVQWHDKNKNAESLYLHSLNNESYKKYSKVYSVIICKEKLLQMRKLFLFILFSQISIVVFSQHEHHQMTDTVPKKQVIRKKPPMSKKKVASAKKDTMTMQPSMDHSMHSMSSMPSHAYSRNLLMNRNGSGTGWNPDASPMYMWMKSSDKTDWMFHGSLFLRYTNQDIFSGGSRGADAFSAPNWFMTMMNRKIGNKGLLNATAMISLDRLTEGGNGYPLLFQSGETFKGQRLVDRQHPHDLFSALSIAYTQMLNKDADVFAYFGYPGEPAFQKIICFHPVESRFCCSESTSAISPL